MRTRTKNINKNFITLHLLWLGRFKQRLPHTTIQTSQQTTSCSSAVRREGIWSFYCVRPYKQTEFLITACQSWQSVAGR